MPAHEIVDAHVARLSGALRTRTVKPSLRQVVVEEGYGWHLHADAADDGPWGAWLVTSSALGLAALLAERQDVPGGLCASASCGKPFAHTGGGSPRRYCSPRCATRERVAAHRAQKP